MRTKLELNHKVDMIIDSLKGYSITEKYFILDTLYHGFLEVCKKEGIKFALITDMKNDKQTY